MDNTVVYEKDGQEIKLVLKKPTREDEVAAKRVAIMAFNQAIEDGALFRKKLREHMTKQGLWSDEEQAELDSLEKKIKDNEMILRKGGIKKSEAREIALNIVKDKFTRNLLSAAINENDTFTVEGQSDDMKFNYLVSRCVFDENDNRVFKDIDDYLTQSEEPHYIACATKLSMMIYGVDIKKWQEEQIENQVLKQLGFMDDDLRLINENGEFVDTKNRRVNKEGRLINDDGQLVDNEGNLINEDGTYKIEQQPFLD